MANYASIYLQKRRQFIENDAFDLSFKIIDEDNDILASDDLSSFKFNAEITNGSYELLKEDAKLPIVLS